MDNGWEGIRGSVWWYVVSGERLRDENIFCNSFHGV